MAYKFTTKRLILYALMVVIVFYTTLLFATFKSARDKLSARVSALYQAAFTTPEKTTVTHMAVHERKIVPPPPAPPPPTSYARIPQSTFKPGRSKPVPVQPQREVDEVVTETREEPAPRRSLAEKNPSPTPETEPARPTVIAKGKEQETAFNNLLAGNKRMADLVNQTDPKLKFKNWSVLKSEGDEHWVDVVMQNTANNSEVHYTWSINNASKKIVPINHYAKQLAAR